jgi:hypothetical protein
VLFIFLFLHKPICCNQAFEPSPRNDSNVYNNIIVSWTKYEISKSTEFSLKIFGHSVVIVTRHDKIGIIDFVINVDPDQLAGGHIPKRS